MNPKNLGLEVRARGIQKIWNIRFQQEGNFSIAGFEGGGVYMAKIADGL